MPNQLWSQHAENVQLTLSSLTYIGLYFLALLQIWLQANLLFGNSALHFKKFAHQTHFAQRMTKVK